MTQTTWSSRLGGAVAASVRRHRTSQGMSAQVLADRCEALGLPIGRSVLANFESGRRPTVSVPELLVLARALGVPPIALICPVDQDDKVEILPGQEVPTYGAMTWFTGEQRFPGDDGAADEPDDPAHVRAYRAHAAHVAEWWRQSQQAARWAPDIDTDPAAESRVKWASAMVNDAERNLRNDRRELRRAGLRLPELPAELSHLDTEGETE